MRPFEQLRFADVPDLPRVRHGYANVPGREVVVDSPELGAVSVHVREHGAGPPLLLVHGLMTSSYSFRYVLEPLGRHYRCIALDLPGAGRSDKPDRPYRAEVLARFLGRAMETLDIAGARVIGNSLGGYLCMWLALLRPDLVGRLVNIHSPGVPLARLHLLKQVLRVPGAEKLLYHLIQRDPERWAHRNVHYFDETLKSREEAREYAAPLSSAEGRRSLYRYLAECVDPGDMGRFVDALRSGPFPVPLLLLYARRDPMVPPVVGRRLHELVPSAQMVWMEDASHFAHVDAPARLVEHVLPFLEGR